MESQIGKILVVDDEQDILNILSYNLIQENYVVITARNGEEAIEKAKMYLPNLILLDVMMPIKDGFETCKELRAMPEFKETQILFLTAQSNEESEIKGLDLGADDFISKPIKPNLLMTRIKSAMRRVEKTDGTILLNDIEINREKFSVTIKGQNVVLPRKEFELFALLASKPGKVFLRQEILDKIWGNEVIVGDRTIDVHVRKIRKKINVDYIHTIKGVGYKFEQ